MIRRVHQYSAVLCIQLLMHSVKCLVCLLLCGKTADHCPALGIEPHIRLFVCPLSNHLSFLREPSDKPVLIPAEVLNALSQFFLFLIQKGDIGILFLIHGKLL